VRSSIGQPQITIYDTEGKIIVAAQLLTLKTTSITGQPWNTYEITLNMSSVRLGNPLDEGRYFFYMTAGTSPQAASISEPIEVKAYHEGTLLIEATHDENDFDVAFETGFVSRLRVFAVLRPMEISFKRKVSSYENQIQNRKNLSSVPYKSQKLIIATADGAGVAPWMPEKVNALLCLSSFKIEGKEFVAEGDELEKQAVVGYPKGAWTVELREGKTLYGKRIFASGTSDRRLTIVSHVRTKLFGSLNAPASTIDVQITDIE
jgi:hypothetical protein